MPCEGDMLINPPYKTHQLTLCMAGGSQFQLSLTTPSLAGDQEPIRVVPDHAVTRSAVA